MTHSWPKVKLGLVCTPVDRAVVPTPGTIYRQIGVKLWGAGAYERETIEGSQTKYTRFYRTEKNDIIMNKIWARNGSVAVVNESLAGCYASGEFPMFALKTDRIMSRWIHWITKTRSFWAQCDAVSQGTSGKNRIKPEQFLKIEIPLPPLPEQRRIVARIDELATQIHEARALSQQATEESELFFHVALKALRNRLLNCSYTKATLGSLTRVTSGGTPSRDNPMYWNGNIPWVKTGELIDCDISDSEEKISECGVENSSAQLFPPNTVLIALYGQGQTRGRTGLLQISATTNQACCAVLPNNEKFEPRFIQFWLRSLYTDLREVAHGGAQPNWNGEMIKGLVVSLPPLSEQRRIVAEWNALQMEVDALKHLQYETSAGLDAMLPSILDRAFKGDL